MKNTFRLRTRESHWSQDALAARAGVSRQCINAIEEGAIHPSIALAYNISIALGRSASKSSRPQAALRPFAPERRPECSRKSPGTLHVIWEIQNDCQRSHLHHRLLLALGFWLMGELKFLIPYRSFLYHQYGTVILAWVAVVFVNVFAAAYAIHRKFFLKDTGRKLSHLDKQVTAGHCRYRLRWRMKSTEMSRDFTPVNLKIFERTNRLPWANS